MDDTGSTWQELFRHWPADMQRRGVLVTKFSEQIPFSWFASSATLLFIERQTPDSLGARAVVLPYEQVAALKVTDVLKGGAVQAMGFQAPAANRNA
jgi:hypothetical protein